MYAYPLPPAVEVTPQFVSERARAASFAHKGGYFFLPCPLCGIEYGGHESGIWTDDPVYPSHIPNPDQPPRGSASGWSAGYVGICPYCTQAKRGWDWPPSSYPED